VRAGEVSSQRVAKASRFSQVVDYRAARCARRSRCPCQQRLGGKRLTRVLRKGLRGEGGIAVAWRRRVDFLTPVPDGDHSIMPAAQSAEGLDRPPLRLVKYEG